MEDLIYKKKETIDFFLKKNILLSSDFFDKIRDIETERFYEDITKKIKKENFLVLTKDLVDFLLKKGALDINWYGWEKAKALFEKGKGKAAYNKFLELFSSEKQEKKEEKVKILFSYTEDSKKWDMQHFVSFFNARYKILEKLLRPRQELKNLMSINRVVAKRERDVVSLIGIVKEKDFTKNDNLMLTLEDPTGYVKVLVNKNRPDIYKQASDIVLDEVIGVVGVNGENIVFANNIVWPEVPQKELKKSKEEAYVLFLSDLHVGSNKFLPEDFNRFIKWINGEIGNEKQRAIAKKVKYIFIVGDLVDGCGVYPEQEKELLVKDIYKQYEECAKLLKQIPKHINIIICPGNHDAMRLAEPQPAFYKDFAKPLFGLENTTLVSNPALVNIHSSDNFPGFDVLMYHGYSFDFFVANVDGLRNSGGYDRADLIMKFLLQRRHLAPTHTSTLYLPDPNKDPLVIDHVPDFFVTGHLHKSIAANYKNITLICGSCWQSKTSFQEKVGHNPEPSRVPMVNLATREIKIMKFGK